MHVLVGYSKFPPSFTKLPPRLVLHGGDVAAAVESVSATIVFRTCETGAVPVPPQLISQVKIAPPGAVEDGAPLSANVSLAIVAVPCMNASLEVRRTPPVPVAVFDATVSFSSVVVPPCTSTAPARVVALFIRMADRVTVVVASTDARPPPLAAAPLRNEEWSTVTVPPWKYASPPTLDPLTLPPDSVRSWRLSVVAWLATSLKFGVPPALERAIVEPCPRIVSGSVTIGMALSPDAPGPSAVVYVNVHGPPVISIVSSPAAPFAVVTAALSAVGPPEQETGIVAAPADGHQTLTSRHPTHAARLSERPRCSPTRQHTRPLAKSPPLRTPTKVHARASRRTFRSCSAPLRI